MTFREAEKMEGFMKYVYPACFYKEKDNRYSVIMSDFPLATFGDDLPDAMYMASDAAAGRIQMLLEDGEKLPKPSAVQDIVLEQPNGFASLVYVDLDERAGDEPVEKTLTIPSWLNQAAERENIDFSMTFQDALIEKLAL
jgi:predicted RNase H-like HicB family nuclease